MKKISFVYLLFFLFITACNSGKKNNSSADNSSASKSYSYSDGNGNSYSISKNSFEYIPVKPEESSTGTYSGGAPVKNTPSSVNFQKLASLIQSASEAKSEHTEQRGKGTARIETRDGTATTSFVLQMGSTWIQQIEAVLTEMKNAK